MAGAKRKGKPSASMVIGAFVVICILMIISRSRETLVAQLEPPVGGVKSLYTLGDDLVAIGPDNNIVIYNWSDLAVKPRKSSVNASAALWLGEDKLLWEKAGSGPGLVVSNLGGDKIVKQLNYRFGWKCDSMAAGRGGNFAVLAFKESGNTNAAFGIAVFDTAPAEISDILVIKDITLYDLCITDNGDFIAAAGKKNESGWLAVISVKDKKLLWQRVFEDTYELGEAVFSVDGKSIYCGGPGRVVYELKALTGETAHEYRMEKSELPNKKQYVACVTVTYNGRFMAACTGPSNTAYIWDAVSRELVQKMGVGVKKTTGGVVINNLAFSSGNDLMASGDLTAVRKVNIFKTKLTKNPN